MSEYETTYQVQHSFEDRPGWNIVYRGPNLGKATESANRLVDLSRGKTVPEVIEFIGAVGMRMNRDKTGAWRSPFRGGNDEQ